MEVIATDHQPDVQQDSIDLQHASPSLRADKEFVLAAVAQNGNALQYASESLRSDKDRLL